MRKKDILELKKRLKKDECTFTKMCGCYVDAQKNIVLKLKETLTDNKLVEDFILDLEKKEEILDILNSISEVNKNLLFFKYDMGLSYKEISELLDINENTVKTYLFRAREQFKKLWREKYGYEER